MTGNNESQDRKVATETTATQTSAAPGKAILAVGVVLLVLLLSGAYTYFERGVEAKAVVQETERDSIPSVAITYPAPEESDELVLPGTLQAYEESPIFARTNGYLLRWYSDIGSRVRQGELLAKIDTPEVDQELNQARATQLQILAQMKLAKISADRWENLLKTDSVSTQEADEKSSDYDQTKANLAAADANVQRLEQLESFKNVYAPFSGVLTKRNVDPGDLINAGASSGSELFDLARVDTLRVFINVPQAYAPFIKVGGNANVTLQEYPGQKFSSVIARTADAIDPETRTLLTEVDVKNGSGQLLPGAFAKIHFPLESNRLKLTIPVNAMLFRSEGARAAVISADNRVHLRAITIGNDYGTTLEILDGLDVRDRIAVNPPDSLEDGEKVHVIQPIGKKQRDVSTRGPAAKESRQ
jgi:RND family efflux transporter MFP subunit